MTDEGKKIRFREWVKAMPEKERNAFWRSIIAVCDAGRGTGTPPEDLAKFWVETYTEIDKQLKETT